MILARTFTIFALAAALGVPALPADAAQRRTRGGDGGQRASGGGQRGDGGQRGADGGRQRAARPANPGGAQARPGAPPIAVPRDARQDRPGSGSGFVTPRGYRQVAPVPVFRGRGGGWAPYRSYGPRIRFVSPYYAFRPRLSIGTGLWLGFSVPFPAFGYGAAYPYGYPYSYGNPYAYGYPSGYGYPVPYPYPSPYPVPTPYPAPYTSPYTTPAPQGQAPSTSVSPVAYGGVSFQITPEDAEVWVDGGYAGRANEFGPNDQPLTLTPGVHQMELRAPGHRPLAFDVTVTAGQVTPFQGALQPGL